MPARKSSQQRPAALSGQRKDRGNPADPERTRPQSAGRGSKAQAKPQSARSNPKR
jgi:hypothetical protein